VSGKSRPAQGPIGWGAYPHGLPRLTLELPTRVMDTVACDRLMPVFIEGLYFPEVGQVELRC
jgi:hypothetical protein